MPRPEQTRFGQPVANYRLNGKGFPFETEHEVPIDEDTVKRLSTASVAIGSPPPANWKDILREIGTNLLDALSKDRYFMTLVTQGLGEGGEETSARVRFVVKPDPPDMYGLALEAVLCPLAPDEYWMLSAPVYRRVLVNEPSTGGYLFTGGQRINCLIIDATTPGLVGDPADPVALLRPIPNVSKECEWVEELLVQNKSGFNIGDVRLLRNQPQKPPLAQQVKEALESRDWGIVHYGGHSHYDNRNNTGYVFFPGSPIESVEMKRFSDWLRRVAFTYFSSCDSGAGPFVFELAKRRVSNILGFRWEIDDKYAFEYAKEFYQSLFGNRSLEQAFLSARKRMYKDHADDRI